MQLLLSNGVIEKEINNESIMQEVVPFMFKANYPDSVTRILAINIIRFFIRIKPENSYKAIKDW